MRQVRADAQPRTRANNQADTLEAALAGVDPDEAAAAAALLRREEVTAAHLLDGVVTDADLEEIERFEFGWECAPIGAAVSGGYDVAVLPVVS